MDDAAARALYHSIEDARRRMNKLHDERNMLSRLIRDIRRLSMSYEDLIAIAWRETGGGGWDRLDYWYATHLLDNHDSKDKLLNLLWQKDESKERYDPRDPKASESVALDRLNAVMDDLIFTTQIANERIEQYREWARNTGRSALALMIHLVPQKEDAITWADDPKEIEQARTRLFTLDGLREAMDAVTSEGDKHLAIMRQLEQEWLTAQDEGQRQDIESKWSDAREQVSRADIEAAAILRLFRRLLPPNADTSQQAWEPYGSAAGEDMPPWMERRLVEHAADAERRVKEEQARLMEYESRQKEVVDVTTLRQMYTGRGKLPKNASEKRMRALHEAKWAERAEDTRKSLHRAERTLLEAREKLAKFQERVNGGGGSAVQRAKVQWCVSCGYIGSELQVEAFSRAGRKTPLVFCGSACQRTFHFLSANPRGHE